VPPVKLVNHSVMQMLDINICSCYADGTIPITANSYNLDLYSFVAVQKHVMSLHQNDMFLSYSTYVPRKKHLIGNKLKCVPSQHRPMFESMFDAHDKEVDKYCDSLQQSHQMLVSKQIELSETFGEMIDEVLRAATQRDTQQEGINSYVYFKKLIKLKDN
jgi:transcription elongation factor Elf1